MTRRSSLLWTFSGAFLLVLVVGVVLQGVLIAAVLRPAARTWGLESRRAAAREAASAVAIAIEKGNDILPVLRSIGKSHPAALLFYRGADGRMALSRDDPLAETVVRRALGSNVRGRPRPALAIAPVIVSGEEQGEVIAMAMRPELAPWPPGTPRPGLLFLPLAAIIAGAAGFLLFKRLSSRLEHLEDRVRRVASGDLDARVESPGGDEIGRLGDSFNRMAERLKESRAKLVEADKQRRRFLADVTHDLATPLTSIQGYAETLLDPRVPKSDEERERYLRFIQEESARMDRLVEDLLDLARVESGGLPLEKERVDLAAIAQAEAERLRRSFEEGGLSLRGLEAPAPVVAFADPARLGQLIANLLQNARQHARGEVRIFVEPAAGGGALLIVEDDGAGFSDEDLPFVFDRFYRGAPSRPAGGTGLGLAIVRGIARAHGGDASAENGKEGGARVVVTLPGETAAT